MRALDQMRYTRINKSVELRNQQKKLINYLRNVFKTFLFLLK